MTSGSLGPIFENCPARPSLSVTLYLLIGYVKRQVSMAMHLYSFKNILSYFTKCIYAIRPKEATAALISRQTHQIYLSKNNRKSTIIFVLSPHTDTLRTMY